MVEVSIDDILVCNLKRNQETIFLAGRYLEYGEEVTGHSRNRHRALLQ